LPDELTVPGPWKRLLLGALLIVAASASTTAYAAITEVDKIVAALGTAPALDLGANLAEAEAGSPQTLMLIGSDKRAKTSQDAISGLSAGQRSDTVILVRLDPARNAIALMSLPRDLKVDIPGHGTEKLNEAYYLGGPKLTLETVKQLTGLRINHVVNVDFGGFRAAVNAIGCVYVDIDRRYFNDNTGPMKYATIDVPQGYQKLCGQDALDYVRYRHDDNDLVRSARQQDFLRQAKQQVGVGRLYNERDKLVRLFGRYTTSDIRTRESVLRLLRLLIASAGKPVSEIHFEGNIGQTYVTASHAKVRKLAEQFLGVEETVGPRSGTRSGRRPRRARSRPVRLEDATADGREQAARARAAGARIPVYYPTERRSGAFFADAPRVYGIRGPDGRPYNSYRMVVRTGDIGEYYGIQGTAWRDPPILRAPSETRAVGGRRFDLHYDGDRLRLVAWRTDRGVYWISNTLLQTLSEREMLAIARSTSAR
jgi:LCP family protein required for cell wall assembly